MKHFRGFISRRLDDSSPLVDLREEYPQLTWYDQSMIEFKQVLFTHIPRCDWIFFTSPRAVHFFFRCVEKHDMPLPDQLHWAVMGSGTAERLKKHDIQPDFTGSGKPNQTAQTFLRESEGQTVLFPRASTSKRSIQRALKEKIQSIDLIVYDNIIREDIDIPPVDVAILSSPMNASGFIRNYQYEYPKYILAWGSSTESRLKELGIERVRTLKKPSEEAAARELRHILEE